MPCLSLTVLTPLENFAQRGLALTALLAVIEPIEKEGYDRRIFQCLTCYRSETVVVNFCQT